MAPSASFRVFKGCTALLAPAKAAAKPKPAITSSTTLDKSKPRSPTSNPDKSCPNPARPTGILKVTPVSSALGNFLGVPEVSRTDAVKKIWAYIKLHNLQNPTDKREIQCDEKLKTIFDGKEKVGFLEIGKLLSRHFVKTG